MNQEHTELSSLTLPNDIKQKIQNWLDDPTITSSDKEEVKTFIQKKDTRLLKECFETSLVFGTGGIRGIMGAGFSRINKYFIRKVAKGYADFLLSRYKGEISVVIAYDSRHNSQEFARETARVLGFLKIKVWLFENVETTPLLSFALRTFHCQGGICFTASHNPPEYNGIKIYSETGGQILPPDDDIISAFIANQSDLSQIHLSEFDVPWIQKVPFHELWENYAQKLKDSFFSPQIKNNFKVIYTPLHGTGGKTFEFVSKSFGIEKLFFYAPQMAPDGRFPTISKPNPEDSEALIPVLMEAEQKGYDVVLATDPDADRMALCLRHDIYAKTHFAHQSHGSFVLLNGNQTGALLLYYLLSRRKKESPASQSEKVDYIVKTIVTTDLLELIANKFRTPIYETLTGFKWIAGLIESQKDASFLFGGEESYGYLFKDFVRDKDGISSMILCLEMINHLSSQEDIHPLDYLLNIFSFFGGWYEKLITLDLSNQKDPSLVERVLSQMQKGEFSETAGQKLTEILDYKNGDRKKFPFKLQNLPSADVVEMRFKNIKISIRPSGTEPKLKAYISVCINEYPTAPENFAKAVQMSNIVEQDLLQFLIKH